MNRSPTSRTATKRGESKISTHRDVFYCLNPYTVNRLIAPAKSAKC